MFSDSAIIFCQAGQGGDGCNSFLKGKGSGHHRPDGGDGGHGGSIVLVTDPQVHTLLDLQMRKTFRGRDGKVLFEQKGPRNRKVVSVIAG